MPFEAISGVLTLDIRPTRILLSTILPPGDMRIVTYRKGRTREPPKTNIVEITFSCASK